MIKKNDIIMEPKHRVQCAMVRGITKAWKQLVYYDFDKAMTKDVLFDIILKLEAAGFVIVAIVSDLSSSNFNLWKSLDISINNTSFTNPATSSRQVFVFADAPHLLKLIRNNFLDYGFTLHGNSLQTVTNASVRELILRSVHDLKTAYRLSQKHIDVQGAKRMNVRLAAQLMSETTGKSLHHFGEQGLLKSKDWYDTSKFILLVDSWFDIFNSKALNDVKECRAAFGRYLVKQTEVVEKMLNTVHNMKVGIRDRLYPFQKGIIVSCQSLLKLHQFLNASFGVKYVITHRLNQDGLEHLFGYLRQMGASYQHPSSIQIKYRIRSYLLGKNSELVGSSYNTNKENLDPTFSGMSGLHHDTDNSENDVHTTETLESELLISAMLFSTDQTLNNEEGDDEFSLFNVKEPTLENCMETEGLKYIGGFIVKKFPKYSNLGEHVKANDDTWIGAVSGNPGKLMTPSTEFFEKLQIMEKMFLCYHGKKTLKPGRGSIRTLTNLISPFVDLPGEVIQYFIKCRMFFRIRILNREARECSRKEKKKIKQLAR